MTRIISGTAGGRRLATPPGSGTRPTSDRVREALFSTLESRGAISGTRVLDLYAGSGALGLEAASRGARSVTLVESDRRAATVARKNATDLGMRNASVRQGTVERVLATPASPHDLVMLDPPYDISEDVLGEVLAALATGWLAPGALVVVERSGRSPEPTWPRGLQPDDSRRYGETAVWFAEFTVIEEA